MEKFKKFNSTYLLILPGLTTIKFKIYSIKTISSIIHNFILYNDDKIQKNNIIRSCKIIGISINLDGTENYLVKKNSELCEEIIGPDDVINDNDDDIYSEDSSISSDSKSKKNNLEQPKITNYFNKLDDNHMDIEN